MRWHLKLEMRLLLVWQHELLHLPLELGLLLVKQRDLQFE